MSLYQVILWRNIQLLHPVMGVSGGRGQAMNCCGISGVFGAKCMEFTLKPRLVLTNASDQELWLETQQKRQGKLDQAVCLCGRCWLINHSFGKNLKFRAMSKCHISWKNLKSDNQAVEMGSWRVACDALGSPSTLEVFNDGNVTRLP